jgi:hypothetical protein
MRNVFLATGTRDNPSGKVILNSHSFSSIKLIIVAVKPANDDPQYKE